MKDNKYSYWLCEIPGIGIHKIQALEQVFHTPEAVFGATKEELEKVPGITKKEAIRIVESRSSLSCQKGEPYNVGKYSMSCCTYFSEEYPQVCRNIFDPPKRLFWKGKFPSDKKPKLAIVGARQCSVYGRETARHFARVLAQGGMEIISGMAKGIDGWAHQGALEGGGDTFAVLGNSAEICYPREHERLYQSIIRRGGVLSEYPPGTKAMAAYFPMRNRIISAMAEGVLIVEARKKSGSLITADTALNQGKDVFVIPGRIGDELSKGCNHLIQQGAFLVTSPQEILDFYEINHELDEEKMPKINIFLETNEKMVYASLSLEPKHLNEITQELQMDSVLVMKCVLSLLKSRLIKEIGNHYYIRNNS